MVVGRAQSQSVVDSRAPLTSRIGQVIPPNVGGGDESEMARLGKAALESRVSRHAAMSELFERVSIVAGSAPSNQAAMGAAFAGVFGNALTDHGAMSELVDGTSVPL